MKNKVLLLGMALLLTSHLTFGQDTLRLTFEKSIEGHFNVQYPGMKIEKTTVFKGIPDAMDAQVYLFNLQRRQSSMTNFQKGYYSDTGFKKLIQTYKLDTAGLYKGMDIYNAIPIVSAIYPGNRKVIIADLNFNNDFSDDKAYEYQIPDFDARYPQDSLDALHVNYDYFYEGKPHKKQLHFKLLPATHGYHPANPEDKPLMVVMAINQWRSAHVRLEGKEYEIALDHPRDIIANYTAGCDLMIKDVAINKQILFETTLKPGVFFPLGGKMVKVDNISYFGDTAQLIVK
jgi:hypothetical protein